MGKFDDPPKDKSIPPPTTIPPPVGELQIYYNYQRCMDQMVPMYNATTRSDIPKQRRKDCLKFAFDLELLLAGKK